MASLSELNLKFRLFMKVYRYQHYDTAPHTPLQVPLNECSVALITTAGFYLPTQEPFDESIKGGDCSYREIPNSIETELNTTDCKGDACPYHQKQQENRKQELTLDHKSEAYDTSDTYLDVNLVFPLDRFRELEAEGKIGTLNHRHFSFMGSITRPQPLIEHTAPEVGQLLKSDDVNVAFLLPV